MNQPSRETMYESEAQRLRTEMESVVGDDLRSVAVVGADFFDVRHVRDDVVPAYDSGAFDDFLEVLRAIDAETAVTDTDLPFGDRRGVVLHYENVVVTLFPFPDALLVATYDARESEDAFGRAASRLSES
jgi:hypothetical protein